MDAIEKTKSGIAIYKMGAGPSLVVVGGGPGISSRVYRKYLTPLSAIYTCYFWDFRGTGLSQTAPSSAFDQDYQDFLSVVESIQAEYSVLAHSYGGLIALQHAIASPKSVQKLFLVGTSAHLGEAAASGAERKLKHLGPELLQEQGGLLSNAAGFRRFLEIEATYQLFNPSKSLLSSFVDEIELNLQVLSVNTDWVSLDFTPKLEQIRSSTVVICGSHDLVVPARFSDSLAKRIPGAQSVTIQDSGHWPFAEQSELFFRALKTDFVAAE